jgi:hypothetical protein
MEQTEFLKQQVFIDLKNLNDGFDEETICYFSETDFEKVLERVQHLGIGIFTIKPRFKDEFLDIAIHEEYRKKATDPKWYTKAFKTLKHVQPGLMFSATYKVSPKLLARESAAESSSDNLSTEE